MWSYVAALGAGLLVGVIYGVLTVRSPAPPVIALVGLLGILLGEQAVPLIKRMVAGHSLTAAWTSASCQQHVFGRMQGQGADGSVNGAASGAANAAVIAATQADAKPKSTDA
jgi:XapX domain-containing protein